MKYPKFKVCVSCMTFNHSKYITDAMNGFTMQQTDFPFVCTIVDDASTDGEQDVIRKYVEEHFDLSIDGVSFERETDYAHIIYAQHKSNKNCFFAILFLKENHYSQKKDKYPYLKEWQDIVDYISLCEGDDYWIDPIKLQKQYDFMGSNHSYSLCGSNGIVLAEKCHDSPKYFNNIVNSREIAFTELANYWTMPTASLFYRKEVRENYPNWARNIISGDQTLLLLSSRYGRIFCLSDLTCVYRKITGGSIIANYINGNELMCQKNFLSLYKHFLHEYGDDTTKTILERKIEQLGKRYIRTARKNKWKKYFLFRVFFSLIKFIKEQKNNIVYKASFITKIQ